MWCHLYKNQKNNIRAYGIHMPLFLYTYIAYSQVKKDNIEAKGGKWPADEEEAFKKPVREQYETQGHPYYASARMWDDGVIDPADTRMVLGLGISAALNAPVEQTRFGIFRM